MASNSDHPYTPLGDDGIRVLRFDHGGNPSDIRCSLQHVQHYRDDEAPDYIALSYCWGDAALTLPITLDGRAFAVTHNLWMALFALRSNGHSLFWIDAICINQCDLDERNRQVRQMWRIFASAKLVISWLGRGDESTDIVFDAARDMEDSVAALSDPTRRVHLALEKDGLTYVYTPQGDPPQQATTVASTAWGKPLMRLCALEYFSRAWIIPEVLQAPHAILVCGARWMRWSTFQLLAIQGQAFWGTAEPDLARVLHDSPAIFQAVKICEIRSMRSQGAEFADAVEIFYDVLDFYSLSRCTDVRDRIFAFLSDPRLRALDLLSRFRADYALTPGSLALVVLAQLSSLVRQRDGRPGQVYDQAVLHVMRSLAVDISSQSFYDWLKPQISRVYESARTAAGNAVYMIELEDGLSFYLDTFQLRRIRKDAAFADVITSPADKWGNISGCPGEEIDLDDVADHTIVIPLKEGSRRGASLRVYATDSM